MNIARSALGTLLLLLASGLGLPQAARGAEEPALVFAAASLANVLQAIGDGYVRQGGKRVRFSFDASSTLARQIEAGAPAQLFFSADTRWMDYLEQHHRIAPGSRRDLLGNALVLIAPRTSTVRLVIARDFPLRAALGTGRLALADPAAVPAGRYGRAALEHLGVWGSVAGQIAPAENVRAALEYVARGEAPLGIVYRTDALIEPRVRTVGEFPAASHPPIVYPVAATTTAGHVAMRFLSFLQGSAAGDIFRRYGFSVRR